MKETMGRAQQRSQSRIKRLVTVLTLSSVVATPYVLAREIQVGRYATVRAAPTQEQVRLLATIVNVQFPASIGSVGEALAYLLEPSGYRLSGSSTAEPTRAILLELSLPEPHRALGPMPLQTALETLAGPPYRLVEDPVHRLVSFERCGPAESAPHVTPSVEAR
jgi:type IV pili sensor histidine kinase/response regulator